MTDNNCEMEWKNSDKKLNFLFRLAANKSPRNLKYRRLLTNEFLKENPLISKSVGFYESNA